MILRYGQFNRYSIIADAALFVLMLAAYILCPGAPLFAPRLVLGGIALAFCLVLLCLGYLKYRRDKYGSYANIPVAMAVIWCLYTLSRLL